MGFVKLSHDLKSWAWIDDPKTVYIYVRLLLGAAWAETDYRSIHLQRGQIAISQREFAEKCGISRQELRTIIDRLTATHKITQTSTRKFSIITMVEYDCTDQPPTHNSLPDQPGINPLSTRYQPSVNPPSLYKKEDKKDKKIRTQESALTREGVGFEESFDKFWDSYPKKTSKQQALKAWEKLKPDEELLQVILTSLERQKKSVQWTKDNGQYIPYPATWLNGRRWEDELQEVNENGITGRNYQMPTTEAEWLKGFVGYE